MGSLRPGAGEIVTGRAFDDARARLTEFVQPGRATAVWRVNSFAEVTVVSGFEIQDVGELLRYRIPVLKSMSLRLGSNISFAIAARAPEDESWGARWLICELKGAG